MKLKPSEPSSEVSIFQLNFPLSNIIPNCIECSKLTNSLYDSWTPVSNVVKNVSSTLFFLHRLSLWRHSWSTQAGFEWFIRTTNLPTNTSRIFENNTQKICRGFEDSATWPPTRRPSWRSRSVPWRNIPVSFFIVICTVSLSSKDWDSSLLVTFFGQFWPNLKWTTWVAGALAKICLSPKTTQNAKLGRSHLQWASRIWTSVTLLKFVMVVCVFARANFHGSQTPRCVFESCHYHPVNF